MNLIFLPFSPFTKQPSLTGRRSSTLSVAGVLSVLFLLAPGFSQNTKSGAISGWVKDPEGAVISGAQITITNETIRRVERTLTSTADGLFSATLLSPGSYILAIQAPGFKPVAVKVPVFLNQTSRLDVKLEIGTTSEVLDVGANASLLHLESATTGEPIDSSTLKALPLPVPNVLFLLSLSAGTASEIPDVRQADRGTVDINVNGQRSSNNSVTLEGINVNDVNLAHLDTVPLPNPHAIEEFSVATSLYDVSSGSKGGGAVGLIFKSGTKEWHGEFYAQHRNDWLNANEWFFNHNQVPRQKFLHTVLGISGSGPMPLLGGNWFTNVQGLRARNGVSPNGASTNVTSPVFPTNPDGTTSAALIGPTFGLTPAQVDPTALNILNFKMPYYGGQFLVPRAGQPGCVTSGTDLHCIFTKIAPQSDTQYSISYDRSFNNGKTKISGRWFFDNGNTQLPLGTSSSLAFPLNTTQNNRFFSVNYTQQISNRQLNEFRTGFSRFIASNQPTDLINLSDIGATRPNASSVPGVYQVGIAGSIFFGTGPNDDRGTISNTFDYSDTWSLVLGKHTFRAGAQASRYQLNRFNRFGIRGALGFNDFTDFLRGQIDTLQAASGDPQRYFRATDFSAFFQDDYHLLPNLTFNIGLRWDSLEFANDLLRRSASFDPSRAPAQKPFVLPEDSTSPVVRGGYGIYFQRLSNQNLLQGSLGPPFFVQLLQTNAVGLTLQNPFKNQGTTSAVAPDFIPQNTHFAGVSGNGDPTNPNNLHLFVNDAGQLCEAFGGPANNCSLELAAFATAAPDTHAPYNQQWNLTIERALGKSWVLEISYVGSHYVGGLAIWAPFLAPLAGSTNPITVTDISGHTFTITTNTLVNEMLRSRSLGISRLFGARVDGNVGQAIYHSGQITVAHRFHSDLYFQAAYTLSREIDNVSGSQSGDELIPTPHGQGGANILNFGNNPAQNRARGDFDRPHRLAVSYTYTFPIPKQGIWGSQMFQGWGMSGITILQSGLPFSTLDQTGGRAFGGGVSTGNFICSSLSQAYTTGPLEGRLDHYLNRACFSPAPVVPNAGTSPTDVNDPLAPTGFGNSPRNAFRGPFQQNWDFSVTKQFRVHGRHVLQLRTDFFNVLNHPSFRQPSFVSVGTNAFGEINSTVNPARLIQLGLQYSF